MIRTIRLMLQLEAITLGNTGKDEIYGQGPVNGAAASFISQMTPTPPRKVRAPKRDAELPWIASVPHEIAIAGYRLSEVLAGVSEREALRRDLSHSFLLGSKDPQKVVCGLDATWARYSALFTPYGKWSTPAKTLVRTDIEET